MSNLLKGGFQSFRSMEEKPFVIDANNRKISIPENRVIRPLSEKANDDMSFDPEQNEIVLQDAFEKAKVLRDDAMVKASMIISDANAEADSIRQAAHDEGYQAGIEEGNMEAMKRADEYLKDIQAKQADEIKIKEQQMQDAYNKSVDGMIDVCCKLVEKFTGILVKEYKPVLLYMINDAMREADTSRQFTIKVSEGNYTYVSDNSDRLIGAANPGINIEVYGDASLNDEQCIIETDNGIIDLSMDVQMKNLVTAIKLLSE